MCLIFIFFGGIYNSVFRLNLSICLGYSHAINEQTTIKRLATYTVSSVSDSSFILYRDVFFTKG